MGLGGQWKRKTEGWCSPQEAEQGDSGQTYLLPSGTLVLPHFSRSPMLLRCLRSGRAERGAGTLSSPQRSSSRDQIGDEDGVGSAFHAQPSAPCPQLPSAARHDRQRRAHNCRGILAALCGLLLSFSPCPERPPDVTVGSPSALASHQQGPP